MSKLLAIVGMTGSGKSIVTDELVKKGFNFLRFGQITLDIVKERSLEPTEENEKKIREDVRKEHGMGAFAILNIPKIESLLEKGGVIGDGLYSWSEYKILKERYGKNLVVIAVYAPPETRYKRLEERKLKKEDKALRNRPFDRESAKSRDFAEIENIEKGGPIVMADYLIKNTKDLEYIKKQIEEILEEIKI